jgi:hypothetical protein
MTDTLASFVLNGFELLTPIKIQSKILNFKTKGSG